MKTLNKIIALGLFGLTSLAGCMKSYNFDDKLVGYNDSNVNPMIVYSDSCKVTYQKEDRWSSQRTTGKDIKRIKIADARKNQNFGGRTIKYKLFPRRFSIYNPKDSSIMNKERKNFDYYLIKIDSIDGRK
jgi:hypothetical protein